MSDRSHSIRKHPQLDQDRSPGSFRALGSLLAIGQKSAPDWTGGGSTVPSQFPLARSRVPPRPGRGKFASPHSQSQRLRQSAFTSSKPSKINIEAPANPMETALQLPEILTIVLSHLASKADLFACAHVSRLWSPLALSLVYGCAARPLKVHSTARTLQLLNNHKAQKIIQCKLLALEITRATSTLFSELPHLAPRLHTLVISSSATFPAKLLAIVLPQLECLQT